MTTAKQLDAALILLRIYDLARRITDRHEGMSPMRGDHERRLWDKLKLWRDITDRRLPASTLSHRRIMQEARRIQHEQQTRKGQRRAKQ